MKNPTTSDVVGVYWPGDPKYSRGQISSSNLITRTTSVLSEDSDAVYLDVNTEH